VHLATDNTIKATPMPGVPEFIHAGGGPNKDGAGGLPAADAGANTFEAWYGHAKWLEHVNEKGIPEAEYATWVDSYNKKKSIYIVIARPFIEHLMHSAIAMVSGRDTGATLFGPAGESTFFSAASPSDPPRAPRRHADLRQHPGQDDRGPLRESAPQRLTGGARPALVMPPSSACPPRPARMIHTR